MFLSSMRKTMVLLAAVGFNLGLPMSLPLALADEKADKAQGWEEFGRHGDIIIYQRQVPGSDVLAFKGSGTIDAPMAKVFTVVTDTPRKIEWLERTKVARVVEDISPIERIEYTEINLPWPLSNRDFVYRIRTEPDAKNRQIVVTVKSVVDAREPKFPRKVRGEIYSGRFIIKPLDGGARTYIEAEAHADPKGAIPKWVVNIAQKSWPKKTLTRLMKQVNKPDIVASPLVESLLAGAAGSR